MNYRCSILVSFILGIIFSFGAKGGVMSDDFEIVASQESSLAQALASCFNKQVISPLVQNFADSEYCMKFEEPKKLVGKDVLLVQQFSFASIKKDCKTSISDQLFAACFLGDLVKKAGAKKIVGILPYLPYSRQDKCHGGALPGSIYLIGRMLKSAGIADLVCLDVHAPEIKKDFAVSLHEALLHEFWADFIKSSYQDELSDICLVSPDEGRLAFVKQVADILGVPHAYVEKTRYDVNKSKAVCFVGSVKKTAIMIDDMIDTGGTARNACEVLKKEGFEKVIGCFTHAILSNSAVEKLHKSMFDQIVVTDTVDFDKELVVGKNITVASVKDFLCNHVKKSLDTIFAVAKTTRDEREVG